MMKNTIILLLLTLVGIGCAKSQEYKKVDDCSTMFIYSYQFCEEHKNPESLKKYEMVLEVGKKYSRFCSTTNLYIDSLIMLYSKESPDAVFSKVYPLVQNLPSHIFCSYSLYKGYPEAKTTLFAGRDFGASNYYSVTEDLDFGWKIDNSSKKTILGFNCTKATCSFAGRDYEAWFTMEIPINDGPYKFRGLPGLIVKLSDSNKEHVFELQEIENVKNKSIYFVEHTFITTDAKGYVKALEASKSTYINKFNTVNFSDNAMKARAISKVQKRNNFIERY